MSTCSSETSIGILHKLKDDDIYIKHDSTYFKFEITKKAFLKLSKSEQNRLKKLASNSFKTEDKRYVYIKDKKGK